MKERIVIDPESLRCVDTSGVWTYSDALSPQQCHQLAELAIAEAKAERLRGTHHFGGRYENLYWDEDRPELLQTLLSTILAVAAHILQSSEQQLRCGGWFNLAAPGQKTLMHDHAEDDELLSAVCYLRIPPNSGNLVIDTDDNELEIRPQEGTMVLFDPSHPHWVKTNNSDQDRLSFAVNIGPSSEF